MTIETSRRGFLKGLVAAAVATQLPNIPVAKAEAIKEALLSNLINVKGEVLSCGIDPFGNGWFRHWTTFIPETQGHVEFGNSGVRLSTDGPIRSLGVEMDQEPYTVSAWFKADSDDAKDHVEGLTEKDGDEPMGVFLYGQQLECGLRKSQYIARGSG